MLAPALTRALEGPLGSRVRSATRLHGGSINEACCAELDDGRMVFVKSHPSAPPGMFAAEARGLAWLRQVGALRVPEVLAVGTESDGAPAFLALEYIRAAAPGRDFDERLGVGLAALHRVGAPTFGLDHDNFIGSLAQPNASAPDWASFYRDRRIAPLVRRARDMGHLSARVVASFEHLLADLAHRAGPAESPSRLHGDLWGGNIHTDGGGAPCLIDPAVYGGHREVDLAMMRLFGGVAPRTFAAYEAAFPLAPGSTARVALYQLYPLLAHVCLFGDAYVASLERTLSAAIAG